MVDNKKDLICPACGKKMQKVFMSEQNIYLDVCTEGCGGIFFDNREFYKFDENCENISPLIEALKQKQFSKVDDSVQRICPLCGMKMVKNVMKSSHGDVTVDDCYACGGKFLDNSELSKIRSQFETEDDRIASVMNSLFSEHEDEITEYNKNYDEKMKKPSLTTILIKKQFDHSNNKVSSTVKKAQEYLENKNNNQE